MISERFQHVYFFTLLLGVGVIIYFIFQPFITALFLAAMCAVACEEIHIWFKKRMPTRKNMAAFLAVIGVLIVVFVPLSILGVLVFNEARDFYTTLADASSSAGIIDQTLSRFEEQIQVYVPQFNIDLRLYIESGLQWILNHATQFFASFLTVLLNLFIMVITLFYLFRDGKEFRNYLIKLSPFDEKDDEDIIKRIELTISSVIKGTLIIGIIQGVCTAAGFMLFGISQPILWGTVAAVASLIPGVGTALVSVPAILILFASGNIFGAIGYAVWAGFLIGSVDNVLGPILMERRIQLHPLLILISVLGGLVFFGPIGFLAGPVVLALATELIKLYPKFVNNPHA